MNLLFLLFTHVAEQVTVFNKSKLSVWFAEVKMTSAFQCHVEGIKGKKCEQFLFYIWEASLFCSLLSKLRCNLKVSHVCQ